MGRLVQQWASRTRPSVDAVLDQISSAKSAIAIAAVTLVSHLGDDLVTCRAARVRARASEIVCVRGFWQQTLMPALMACIA